MKNVLRFTLIIVVSLASHVVGLAQSSSNYSMDRVAFSSAGSSTASPTYSTTVVIGDDSPGGASSFCNSGFVNSVGFWSVLGDLPVPISLQVDKGLAGPDSVSLAWSGNEASFRLYRSSSPVNVLDPGNLTLETMECAGDDTSSGGLVFYKVVPTP